MHKLLEEKGIESFIVRSIKYIAVERSAIKIVDGPLFKSYVFVKVNEEEKRLFV